MTHTALPEDPYAWLEEVEGAAALDWVRARNAETAATLGAARRFTELDAQIREVLDSDARIPAVARAGAWLYNFWRDAEHPRGLWRRTSPEQYVLDDPDWQVLLDVDALNAAEGEDWVWHGARIHRPDCRRALVDLSHGGSDADVTREFDLERLEFVDPADGGFFRPEAKGGLSWVDADTVFAFSDFGPGTMTTSGYPRSVRRWRRGTPLAEAPVLYEGTENDMYISAHHDRITGRDYVSRSIAFYDSETYLLGADDTLTLIGVPRSAEVLAHREWLAVLLREDWEVGDGVYPAGSLIVTSFAGFLAGELEFEPLFTPTPTTSLAGATWTRHHLVLTLLDDVCSRLEVLTPPLPGDLAWTRTLVAGAPGGTVDASAVDVEDSDELWLVGTDFLTPTTLYLGSAAPDAAPPVTLKSMPAFFDTTGLVAEQHFAVSADGTRVPYFLVRHADTPADGRTPTLLYGYGGFEISLTPDYSGTLGRAWLERGGAYALANIRGGGEYGPTWHQAALQANRHRAYEDFAAVARDLVARGVTAPEHLGVKGGSNGGLLTGNMLVQYPELFGAVVIQVPLLDMKRYSHLLAGASWMAEYGDPDDPEQWEFIRTFSPYHLLDPARTYPPVLLTTSTRDDRVHPGHARKMAALLAEHTKDVTYYENVEGGHGGAADNAQAAYMAALAYEFLWEQLA